MLNDFDIWNNEKQMIHGKQNMNNVFFKEREIWWCHLGLNIGFEQNGKGDAFLRPILVLKKFSASTLVGLPLTTANKSHKYLIHCDALDKVFRQAGISQLRTLDSRRLHEKITTVSEDSFVTIRKATRELF